MGVCGHGNERTFRARAFRSSSCRMLLVATSFPPTGAVWGMGRPRPPTVAAARGLSLDIVRLQHVRGRGRAAERSEDQNKGRKAEGD